jgi:hypothetical protein
MKRVLCKKGFRAGVASQLKTRDHGLVRDPLLKGELGETGDTLKLLGKIFWSVSIDILLTSQRGSISSRC